MVDAFDFRYQLRFSNGLFEQDTRRKSFFAAVSTLVRHIGANPVLSCDPMLLERSTSDVADLSLQSSVSGLLKGMVPKHLHEVGYLNWARFVLGLYAFPIQ